MELLFVIALLAFAALPVLIAFRALKGAERAQFAALEASKFQASAFTDTLQRMAFDNAEGVRAVAKEAFDQLKAQSLESKVRVQSFDRQLKHLENLAQRPGPTPRIKRTPEQERASERDSFVAQLFKNGAAVDPITGAPFEVVG